MNIYFLTQEMPIRYAAAELARCLEIMSGRYFVIQSRALYEPSQTGLWLGELSAFGWQPKSNSALDDEVRIEVKNGSGIIAGSSPRAVLQAVYRFLHAAGCRWVRPGSEGEVLPRVSSAELNIHCSEQASFRHRAITIEGAVSLQNVLDIIEWAPKVGFSGYFMQFREGHTFFDRWYNHQHNPLKAPEGCTVEQAREFTAIIESELQKRGMLYHAIGHGWTCEAFGIPGLGWDPVHQDWPQEVLDALALVNGKRAMWYDIPLITALCLSNPDTVRRVVDCVVDYAAQHPQIDFLHVWMDDGFNNKCECEQCQKVLPSDQYVAMLNAIDREMSARGLKQHIVFLAYFEMLWPPRDERIQNPDRFVFMYAPISRTYREKLEVHDPARSMGRFERNRLSFPSDVDGLLSHLRAWQEVFPGDSFIFDYYLMNAGTFLYDPDQFYLSRLIEFDIKNYPNLGLNGLVSCQMQRVFFPAGLAMYVMGRLLWDSGCTYEELRDEYFQAAFGADFSLAREYLQGVGGLQDLVTLGEHGPVIQPEAAGQYRAGLERIARFRPIIQEHLYLPEVVQARSWFYLDQHAEIAIGFTQALLAVVSGDFREAKEKWAQVRGFVQAHEELLQPVFDVCLFISRYEEAFSKLGAG